MGRLQKTLAKLRLLKYRIALARYLESQSIKEKKPKAGTIKPQGD